MQIDSLLKSSLDLLPQGITIINKSGELVYANQKASELLGFMSADEVLANKSPVAEKFIILDDSGHKLNLSKLPNRQALATGQPQSVILRFKRQPNGSEYWSSVQAIPILNSRHQVEAVVTTFQDVTETKKTEQTLLLLNQISNQLLSAVTYNDGLQLFTQLVVPTISDWCAIDMLDETGNLVQMALSHVDSNKVSLATLLRVKYPPSKNNDSNIKHVLETGKMEIYPNITPKQLIASARDPEHLRILQELQLRSVIVAPLRVYNKILGIITFAYAESGRNFHRSDLPIIDAITQRAALLLDNAKLHSSLSQLIKNQQHTLNDLVESDSSLKLALEVGNMGVWDYKINEDSITWSNGRKPRYSLRIGNFKGTLQDFLSHIVPEDRARVKKKIQYAIQKSGFFEEEFRIFSPDGSYRWMHKIGEVMKDSDNRPVRLLGIGTDITDKKLSLDKIKQSESKFKSVFEGSQDVIIIADDKMRISDINPSGVALVKNQKSKILGKNIANVIVPTQKKEFLRVWKKLQHHSTLRGIFDVSFKDGRRYVMEFNANAQFLPGQTLFVLRDITKRVEAEKRRQHLLSIVSHELRTPITSIKVFTDLLRSQIKNSTIDKSLEYLTKIDEKSNSLTNLINDLLDLARIDAGTLEFSYEMLDFDDFIKQYIEEFQLTLTDHRIKLRGRTNSSIVIDKNRLIQIINNLLRNAVKYSPNADTVILKISADSDFLTICVQDFGTGIPKSDQSKIFNLYFRSQQTADRATGMGVGLYITGQIVKKMAGKIWVKSRLGTGSSFFVTLPLIPK